MICHFDTSAFVPLLIEELSSLACRALWELADDVTTTRLLYVETAAALARLAIGQDQAFRAALGAMESRSAVAGFRRHRYRLNAIQERCLLGRVAVSGHALSDPTRTQVMLALHDGPSYPADLAEQIGVSRQSLSNHLVCLRGCGLVVAEPEGRRRPVAAETRKASVDDPARVNRLHEYGAG